MRTLGRAFLFLCGASLPLAGARADAQASYAALKASYLRTLDTARQLTEPEVDGLVARVRSETAALAATPGSVAGMPNHVAAYRMSMRVAALLFHGHGWPSKASQVASGTRDAVTTHDALLAGYIDNRISWLDQADDGLRVDQVNPYFAERPAPAEGDPEPTNDCAGFDEGFVKDRARNWVENNVTMIIQSVAGTCYGSDPSGMARATVQHHDEASGEFVFLELYVDQDSGTVTPR